MAMTEREQTDHDCVDWNSGGACFICHRPLSIEEQTRGDRPEGDDEKFTRAEWAAAYQRALLLWHQIDAATSGDAQKDIIARALLKFRAGKPATPPRIRRKDLEAL
jgi:hypothetical protein